MRRFIVHALAFAAVQTAILVALWRACPDSPDHYMAATIDKHARLRAAASPRLIFVGGSSVAFGIDSSAFAPLALEPVNMGLSASLGLPFMLGEVAPELRAGDVVVVAPEPELYWLGSKDDAIWAVLQRRPASLRCLAAAGPRAIAEVPDQALHFVARKIRCAAHQMTTDSELPGVYRRSSFDAVGDLVAHRGLAPKQEAMLDKPWPAPDTLDFDHAIAALQHFATRCEQVGARCFITWAPLREAQFVGGAELFAAIEARVRDEVALPMLETPRELTFPNEAFFDRGMHLTGDAAKRRSTRLAERLTAALAP